MKEQAIIDVKRFDGAAPLARPAVLALTAERARVLHAGGVDEYPALTLSVSPHVGGASRFIQLPDGVQLSCADVPALAALPQGERSEGPVAWLERRSSVALVAVLATAVLLVFAERSALPWLSGIVARRIPVVYEQRLGQRALRRLDAVAFSPTHVDSGKQARLRAAFSHLAADLPADSGLTLEFRRSALGANAFALPGGPIIVTDALADACSADQVTAVLAHELGHVARRHGLRQLLLDSGTAAFGTAVFGDSSSLGVAVASVPTLLLDLKYTREFEREADTFAVETLARHGLSPSLFADALSCLEHTLPFELKQSSFLADHPPPAERKQMARRAGDHSAAGLPQPRQQP